MSHMNAEQVNEWIQNWMNDNSIDEEDPAERLDNDMLRLGAVSILQFARDAGLIDLAEYQKGMNPIVNRTHPELGEYYYSPDDES